MKINTEIIKSLKPCQSRLDNYLKYYNDFNGELQDFLSLENITYHDKVWVVTRLFTKEQNVKWALLCASKVLSIFESKYPNDKRPRQALEAVENWLNKPSGENRLACINAANAANAAYHATGTIYAANAAYSAACAAYAVDAVAIYAAGDAANAADVAAYAAAYAAVDVAAAEDKIIEQEVNLLLMLECI